MIWHLKLLHERFDLGRSDVLQELLHVYRRATPHDPPRARNPDFRHQPTAVLPGPMLIFLALGLRPARGPQPVEGAWAPWDVHLTPDDVKEITNAAHRVDVRGERYPEHMQRMIN